MMKYVTITAINNNQLSLPDVKEALEKMGIQIRKIQLHEDTKCCGGEKDKPLPSKIQQLANVIQDGKKILLDGVKLVDDTQYQERLDICTGGSIPDNKCDEYRSDKRCAQCGCFMSVKAKLKKSECPLNKW